jgi:predicted transcriptional regulator
MKTPCEIIVWNLIPVIKRELAKSLVKNFKCNQRTTANKLVTSEAAVSRYISGKRGALEITDKEILNEIKNSAGRIARGNKSILRKEICRICQLIRDKEILEGINIECE